MAKEGIRVAVYTLTRDRIGYTQHNFRKLQEIAGYPYDHFVVDNASEDGTITWLASELADGRLKNVLYNAANLGNAIGNNQAVEMIGPDYDLTIRMDNDCEPVTQGIVEQLVDLFTQFGSFEKRHIVSPRVEGIVHQPNRGSYKWFGRYKLGYVSLVGGLFRAIPTDIIRQYKWPETQSKVFGEESVCQWFRERGGEVAYAEDLVVNHYETTDGQAKRYPEYHKRKMAEA